MPPRIESPAVASFSLLRPRNLLLVPYITPYLFLYSAFAYLYLQRYDEYIGSQEWTFVYFGSICTTHGLLWLSTFWSIRIRALFTTGPAPLHTATRIMLFPKPNGGQPEIAKLIRDADEISFFHQKRRFMFDAERKTFAPPVYLVEQDPPLSVYQSSRGLTTTQVQEAVHLYGENKFDIPIPTFKELFQEHAVAPFFVFQIFCVGLWCLDEYWYYSLFTLFMLVAFESSVVWQRQRTLIEFRGMAIAPYTVWAKRDSKWVEVSSADLVPGDLVSIVRSHEDSGVACDMIITDGSAIVNEAMLSGESTPLLKESIALRRSTDIMDATGVDKNSFLFGGTKVLQFTPAANEKSPDHGALAIVTKTGFETSQGSLVRTMIFSTERVSANNFEALLFILFLLVFAIAASYYVWTVGSTMDRKKSKLLLDCILIITSVVPPELPMELSLAVNSSLAALSKHAIFCTEPFRIPFAGRVDVACFDKTGTLTGENLVVEGVAFPGKPVQPVSDTAAETRLVLSAAQNLVRLEEGEIVGDPMEKATLTALRLNLAPGDKVGDVTVRRRFQFSSVLKRMSTVSSNKKTFVSVKGAPETIKSFLKEVPADYDEYKNYSRMGSRVLSLGYKEVSNEVISQAKVNLMNREEVESGLTFVGFLIFHCPLKPDAIEVIKMLNESSHRCVMITGDNPLTAVHVAQEVRIVERNCLVLDKAEDSEEIEWKSVDEKMHKKWGEDVSEFDFCITGYALALLEHDEAVKKLIAKTWVYARVSPTQKEFILNTLKEHGYTTLMCGDGTNDVGALKQAHIGVALLNGTENDLKRIAEHQKIKKMQGVYEKQIGFAARFNANAPPVPVGIAHLYPPGPKNPHREKALENIVKEKGIEARKQYDNQVFSAVAKAQQGENGRDHKGKQNNNSSKLAAGFADKFMEMQEEDDSEPPTIKLGDASVAAPFTSKLTNVMAIANIIRQGRCTLVATIQMYKILALNCLISAYSLSVLYLDGIKFGDGQVTISGMLMSVCFMCISRAKVRCWIQVTDL